MAEEETLELDFEPMEEIGVGENEDLDVADKLDLPESSEDEKEQSPQKSVINELVSPRKRDRRAISPPDFEEEFRVSSHLAGRLTRVRDNESHDRPKLTPLRTITRKDWGLETPAEDSALTNEEIAKVYESLDVDLDDNRIQLNTIFVKGIDSFNEYEIEKIFAEYEPISSRQGMPIVRFVDRNKSECVLTFKNLYKVAEMFLGMSKELKRVRPAKKPEEGEVMDSEDDEEGQVREENGEDVAVVNSESLTKPISSRLQDIADDSDYIEVDVEKVDVPPGKWRVITKHVPGNHLIIARYARISEINKANRNPINFTSARQASDEKDEQDFQWGSTKDRVRPGLNIFDEKGRELEWDYEHDTRFYEDPNIANDAADKKVEKSSTSETTQSEETLKVGDRVIHSRGRGAKKFVLKSSSSEEDSD